MAITLNHTIVPCFNNVKSAESIANYSVLNMSANFHVSSWYG